jgi:hypothetical protein
MMLGAGVAIMVKPSKKRRPLTPGRISVLVREVERKSSTGGTGQTIIKMRQTPIARLVDERKIGPEEFQAAQDLTTGFMSLAGHLLLRPGSLERVDRSHAGSAEAPAVVDAQRRYRAFANHWSKLAKRGDRTLEIMIAVVIDERPLSVIEADIGLRHGVAKKALVRGLRDYAVRAGWVKGKVAQQWMDDAGATFATVHPALSLAIAAARAED